MPENRASRSIAHLRGETNYKPPKKYKHQYRRANVFHPTHDEIMQWGSCAVKLGTIAKPPSYKPSFPYYLEQYIKFLKSQRGE